MSWRSRDRSQNNKQWRKSQHDYNEEDECSHYRQNQAYYNYNNRLPKSYNSHSNYRYNRNNYYNRNTYTRNVYYQNNKHSQQYQNNNNNNQVNQQRWINKNSKDIKYVKNTGKFEIEEIAINELTSTLQSIWDEYYHKNVQYIEKIILLSGPPGCGKTSVCNYVEKYYNLNKLNDNEYMIDVSNILSVVMKENNKRLIISKAYELLFKQILENDKKNKILIIDGFLRKEQQVYVTDFLKLYMKNTSFIFLVLNVDENTSVQRQLERGKKLVKLSNCNQNNNANEEKDENKKKKIRLKDSDLCEYAARNRYQKYNCLLQAVRYQLKNKIKAQFDVIDATKSLQNVFHNVEIQLNKQDVQMNIMKSHQTQQ